MQNMTLRQAMLNTASQPNRAISRTENGMRAFASTLNANVDLFGSIGAMRGKNVIPAFEKAFNENQDVALRVAQWARDIRGGSGERKLFRDILLHLEQTRQDILLESHLLENIAQIGRFDDLLIFRTPEVKDRAYTIIERELRAGNGLAAKWMPRKGQVAVELRSFMGMSPKQYRKTLVGLTNVVETAMCQREWSSINFNHVPSVAMSRYLTAFHRNAPEAITAYKEALKRNDGTAKVNASAVYPHNVVAMAGGATEGPMEGYGQSSYYSSYYGRRAARAENIVAQRMWEALPDYMNDTAVLPIVDVSGSMKAPVHGSTDRALDVAVALGLYVAERSKNPAFRNILMTFSDRPDFFEVSGTLAQRLDQMAKMQWGGSTNLHAALDKVLNTALRNGVPDAEMPKMLVILSDMQFNQCVRYDDSAMQMMRRKYEEAGYAMPQIVFWNLRESTANNKPVRFNERGVALVSGYSPALLKSVLAADLEKFTPESVMLKTVMVDRYNW